MKRNMWFFRLFFALIACLAAVSVELSCSKTPSFWCFLKGSCVGIIAFASLLALERILKKLPLRAVSTAVVGLFVGSLMGLVVSFSLKTMLTTLSPDAQVSNTLLLFTFLTTIYVGIMLTVRSSESWWLTIPFVHLAPAMKNQKKDILIDVSALEDPRLLELARSGLLDHQLVIATFVIKEIQKDMDDQDEAIRNRARKCYEHFKRLENLSNLGLQVKEFHLSETEEETSTLTQAAKLTHAYILTAHEQSILRQEDDDTQIISLDTIATALKPSAQRGEMLQIKIQRLGKEPKQGVGYLDDGTMVVVNGGGEFLGETIRTQVLSQKYSSSGKIVFCNALMHEMPVTSKISMADTVPTYV